jgi:hypothetical protein
VFWLRGNVFSAAGRPVVPLSFSLREDRGQAHCGGTRSQRMAAKIARTIGPAAAGPTGPGNRFCRHGRLRVYKTL